MSGKGSTPRPIPDRPRYESEFDRIFGARDAVREMPKQQDAPSQADGPEQVQAPIPHAATEARG